MKKLFIVLALIATSAHAADSRPEFGTKACHAAQQKYLIKQQNNTAPGVYKKMLTRCK